MIGLLTAVTLGALWCSWPCDRPPPPPALPVCKTFCLGTMPRKRWPS